MNLTKNYPRVIFSASAVKKIVAEFTSIAKQEAKWKGKVEFNHLTIDKGTESWRFDTFEEFLADLKDLRYAWMEV